MRIFFEISSPLIFAVFSTIRGTVVKKKMRQGARFQGFLDLFHVEVEGHRNFWFRDV